jgi:hypothetical protein
MKKTKRLSVYTSAKRSLFKGTVVALALVLGAVPLILVKQASGAGQIALRSLSVSSGVPSQTGVSYTFAFTVVATSTLQGLKFEACTTAVNTCVAPTGLSFSSATYGSQGGFQGGSNFAVDGTGANNCIAAANVLCANRTDATNQTATSRNITFGTITNQSAVNTSFFVRITTYALSTYTVGSVQDYGVTASATVQTLTTTAAVAEVLNFCVGSTAANAGAATSLIPSDCGSVTGTSVNIGVLSTSQINVSPVTTVNGGNDLNGLVMLRTNSTNGTTVSYDSIQAISGTNHLGTLRIAGATCDPTDPSTVTTDACINSNPAPAILTNGTEMFGMTIAGVNCESTTSYTCTFGAGNYNLTRDGNYDGDGTNNATNFNDTNTVAGTTTNQYAWEDDGTITQIASSSTYVDDEALLLKFAATSALITPFGTYAVQTDFIAVTTY